jgi:hypothetical protein
MFSWFLNLFLVIVDLEFCGLSYSLTLWVIAARLFWAALYICFLLPSKYSLIGLS